MCKKWLWNVSTNSKGHNINSGAISVKNKERKTFKSLYAAPFSSGLREMEMRRVGQ